MNEVIITLLLLWVTLAVMFITSRFSNVRFNSSNEKNETFLDAINSIVREKTKADEEIILSRYRNLSGEEKSIVGLVNHGDTLPDYTFIRDNVETTVLFKQLDDRAIIPTYAHNGDVGMDMTAIDVTYDDENDVYVYHTGLALESEHGYGTFLFPRSSNRRTDAYLCNHVGIADSALYRGEIMFMYKNRASLREIATLEMVHTYFNEVMMNSKRNKDAMKLAKQSYENVINNPMNYAPYKVGERIGQMVVLPYPYVTSIMAETLSDTERGEDGFGSTGK